eukprot:155331-Rhodomonas_salina.2
MRVRVRACVRACVRVREQAAQERLAAKTINVESYAEMKGKLEAGDAGFYVAAWKDDTANEDKVRRLCCPRLVIGVQVAARGLP